MSKVDGARCWTGLRPCPPTFSRPLRGWVTGTAPARSGYTLQLPAGNWKTRLTGLSRWTIGPGRFSRRVRCRERASSIPTGPHWTSGSQCLKPCCRTIRKHCLCNPCSLDFPTAIRNIGPPAAAPTACGMGRAGGGDHQCQRRLQRGGARRFQPDDITTPLVQRRNRMISSGNFIRCLRTRTLVR